MSAIEAAVSGASCGGPRRQEFGVPVHYAVEEYARKNRMPGLEIRDRPSVAHDVNPQVVVKL